MGALLCVCICEHSTTSDSQVDPFVSNEAKHNTMLWSTFLIIHVCCIYVIGAELAHISLCLLSDRILRSYKVKLEKDLQDKFGAQDIDNKCASLTDDHPALAYSPESVKIQTK